MFRVSDIIDLPIYSLSDITSFKYTVKSMLFDSSSNRVSAIVCKEGTLKKRILAIPYERVVSIDINGIVVADYDCIKKVELKEASKHLPLDAIINKTIRSENGELYGMLRDIYINPLTGRITSYELSEGYIDDFVTGRKVIKISEQLSNTLVNKEIVLHQSLN